MSQKLATFPIEEVRKQFPALKRTYNEKPAIYMDGPGGSQVVHTSIEAIARYMENGGANLHGAFPSSRETENIIAEAKNIIADFLNVKSSEVAFGANMTTLAFSVSRSLGKKWGRGDEIVVTEMDHRANVDPWISMAEDRGMTVRWIKADPKAFTLCLDNLDEVINENTKLVAIGLASNAVGTINDAVRISTRAKQTGALVAVDAVHAAPHIPIDREALGADIIFCSAYKFFGPHIGIAAIKEETFADLEPYKLKPAPSYYPDKLETGTQNHEGIAGIKPAIEFFEQLGTGSTRRERIVSGIKFIEEHENRLSTILRDELAKMDNVILYQPGSAVPKTPTIAFKVDGFHPEEVCQTLSEKHAIFIASGDFYATTLANKTRVNETGGWIRAGLAPYNSEDEIIQFIDAIKQL
ncbi:cysteine desulfurase family protein (TIGR01976 family) [Peribacillus deserti]|uniref:Cysteine desulfurase family protein (TIGR01976 family) n=1 Tax=Peribacillus deserti TaxID=673318 RepID=A0ABS2QMW7_9BACI|nr:cysteine desulfurase-like protein [Peribacillus deserti]MBM7694517.1 cysteine desulfurase family protein (TIGR01976 family) [Peribacillus deserti]